MFIFAFYHLEEFCSAKCRSSSGASNVIRATSDEKGHSDEKGQDLNIEYSAAVVRSKMPRQSRLEYDRRGIMGSALSNTCCFSRVSTTMRADPHVRYRRDSNEKKKRLNLSPLVCARFKF